MNFKLDSQSYLEQVYQNPRNVSIKIQKDISSRAGNIPNFVRFHQESMPTTRLTDIHKNQNYLEQLYEHQRNVSIKIQKDISSRAGDIPKFVGFHKGSMPTTRLTDIQKIQNYLEPVYQCPVMSSKNSKKITHPDLEIYLCLISARK